MDKITAASQKYGFLCSSTIYGGECYRTSYCKKYEVCLKSHPNKYCERCQFYICGCCYHHRCITSKFTYRAPVRGCPVCLLDPNLANQEESVEFIRDVSVKEIYQKKLTKLYPFYKEDTYPDISVDVS